VFWPCLFTAFVGAMLIAVSQINDAEGAIPWRAFRQLCSWQLEVRDTHSDLLRPQRHAGGTVARGLDEPGTIAANFGISACILIPATLMMGGWPVPSGTENHFAALLLLAGTLAAGALGRVLYQIALTATDNDNGFVTMFFLFVPGLSSLNSFVLSSWISDLHFAAGWMFFAGLGLVAAPLLILSMKVKQG
jgi:hypothetical protein